MEIWICLLGFVGYFFVSSCENSLIEPFSLLKLGSSSAQANPGLGNSLLLQYIQEVKPKKLGNGIYSVDSRLSLICFMYKYAQKRGINADISSCSKTVDIYLNLRVLPQVGGEDEIVFNKLDLFDLLVKYIRSPGNLEKYVVRPKKSRGRKDKREYEQESEADETPTRQDSPSASSRAEEGVKRASSAKTDHSGEGSYKQEYDSMPTSSPKQQSQEPAKEEETKPKTTLKPDRRRRRFSDFLKLSPEEKFALLYEERINLGTEHIDDKIETHNTGVQIIYSPDEIKFKIDSEESLNKLKQRLLLDIKDFMPWRKMLSMILYKPVRREELKYGEIYCRKVAELMGKILHKHVVAIINLKEAINEFCLKGCQKKKSKAAKFLSGCSRTAKLIKKYTRMYFMTRYDFFDSIILVTQCSLARTEHMTGSTSISISSNYFEKCSLTQYYSMVDYLGFVYYVIIGLNKAGLKINKTLKEKCSCSPLSCLCTRRSKVCEYLKKMLEGLNFDLENSKEYATILEQKIELCMNYLVSNNIFSLTIPESAQYLGKDGTEKTIERVDGTQTVQFPKYLKADINAIAVLESTLFTSPRKESGPNNEGNTDKRVDNKQATQGGATSASGDNANNAYPRSELANNIYTNEWI